MAIDSVVRFSFVDLDQQTDVNTQPFLITLLQRSFFGDSERKSAFDNEVCRLLSPHLLKHQLYNLHIIPLLVPFYKGV